MIVHQVLFDFKPEVTESDLKDIQRELLALENKIPEIKEISCGPNFSNRSDGYNYGLLVKVDSRDALAVYAEHEAHQKVVNEVIRPRLARIIAVDYETSH